MNNHTLNLKTLVKEAFDENILLTEGGAAGRIIHLYEDGKMTFGEMRSIFQDVFQGKTVLTEKLDGANIMVTYKDGKFGFARNRINSMDFRDIIIDCCRWTDL